MIDAQSIPHMPVQQQQQQQVLQQVQQQQQQYPYPQQFAPQQQQQQQPTTSGFTSVSLGAPVQQDLPSSFQALDIGSSMPLLSQPPHVVVRQQQQQLLSSFPAIPSPTLQQQQFQYPGMPPIAARQNQFQVPLSRAQAPVQQANVATISFSGASVSASSLPPQVPAAPISLNFSDGLDFAYKPPVVVASQECSHDDHHGHSHEEHHGHSHDHGHAH
jgi:hypothetical protein